MFLPNRSRGPYSHDRLRWLRFTVTKLTALSIAIFLSDPSSMNAQAYLVSVTRNISARAFGRVTAPTKAPDILGDFNSTLDSTGTIPRGLPTGTVHAIHSSTISYSEFRAHVGNSVDVSSSPDGSNLGNVSTNNVEVVFSLSQAAPYHLTAACNRTNSQGRYDLSTTILFPSGLVTPPNDVHVSLTNYDTGEVIVSLINNGTADQTGLLPAGNWHLSAKVDIEYVPGTPNVEEDAGFDVDLVFIPPVVRLVNLSARAFVDEGSNILIAGFVVRGDGSKNILLRGVGPGLTTTFGLPGALPDPQLDLYDATNSRIGGNDNWSTATNVGSIFTAVGAFPLAAGSKDAALLNLLPANSYTALVSGVAGGKGIGLAEIYDADATTSASRLVNLSARASVGAGGNVLIAGFVISGNTTETILVRGIGPGLTTTFGLAGVLAAPQLAIFDSNNKQIFFNAGWGGGKNLADAYSKVGAFPLPPDSADSALLVTLLPGSYTAQISGLNGTSGIALAEIYEVP